MKRYKVKVNSREYIVEIEEINETVVENQHQEKPMLSESPVTESNNHNHSEVDTSKNIITAPMAGNILKVEIKPQDKVNQGDVLFVLEAMKMENEITAKVSKTIKKVLVQEGDSVKTKQPLLEFEE